LNIFVDLDFLKEVGVFLFDQHVYRLTGASPEQTLVGGNCIARETRGAIARWNLKEVSGKLCPDVQKPNIKAVCEGKAAKSVEAR